MISAACSVPERALFRLSRSAREHRQRARQHDAITARSVAAGDFEGAASSNFSARRLRRQATLFDREYAAIKTEIGAVE